MDGVTFFLSLCFLYYVLPYIFLFFIFSPSFYCRFLLDFFLPSVWTLSIAGLVPRQLVPSGFRNDTQCGLALSSSFLVASGSPASTGLVVAMLPCLCTLGLVQALLEICLPPCLTDSVYNTPPVAFGVALCSIGEYLLVGLFPFLLPHGYFGTSLCPGQCWDSCLITVYAGI